MSGRFNSPTKVVESLLVGIHQLASLFLIYILAMELFHSVLFIIYG
jgi:aminobenzoyl-glutamate transport protein